jgi:hypothetical protein
VHEEHTQRTNHLLRPTVASPAAVTRAVVPALRSDPTTVYVGSLPIKASLGRNAAADAGEIRMGRLSRVARFRPLLLAGTRIRRSERLPGSACTRDCIVLISSGVWLAVERVG